MNERCVMNYTHIQLQIRKIKVNNWICDQVGQDFVGGGGGSSVLH